MAKQIKVETPGGNSYDIILRDSFSDLAKALNKRNLLSGRKVCIVTDDSVGALYADSVKQEIETSCEKVTVFTFSHGEENKNLETVEAYYEHLIQNGFNRKDLCIALGGGVTGDLTGFGVATYQRGMDFVQVPTSLLAMVDSSIGGKTGVDFKSYKNMVGAFHMPKMVYINLSVLESLPDRQFASGMAEILKHGLIKKATYYAWLINHFSEIMEKDMSLLEKMIADSLMIKKEVVEEDPFENGNRALLNFGHTLGHAIEKQSGFSLTHGESVALGCIAAAIISFKRGLLSAEDCYEIRDMFVPFDLPISFSDLNIEAIIQDTKSDKKNEQNHLKFILLEKIGKAFITTDVTDDEMRIALKELEFNEDD